ncbi:hypothetical protein [Teredinibacter purpureus]|uniref:hypothetical protein n=1 Tax=Teredinibacter purpureus TaxID=2731756 RepID=UPI0013C51D44|nr:hypothetical protein [Teredinibacter purpureus]
MAIIGIDFVGGGRWLIPNRLGEGITPSVVGLDDNGKVMVGKIVLAKRNLVRLNCQRWR